jgi:hypothetical protein
MPWYFEIMGILNEGRDLLEFLAYSAETAVGNRLL